MNIAQFKPHTKQREFMLSPARFKVGNWSRRTGKSFMIGATTILHAMDKPGNYYIIAPTYRQAKSIFWNDILKLLVPKEMIEKTDETQLYIQLKPLHYKVQAESIIGHNIDSVHAPNEPSIIWLKGADNPDSLRGVKLRGAVLDEYAFFKDGQETWRKIIRPALADYQGWAIFTSTPDGVNNCFYDVAMLAQKSMRDKDGKYFYSHATMLDNEALPHRFEEWEQSKREYERDGRIDEWVQEWEAKFTTPSTMVYNEFNEEKHIISPMDVPRDNMTYVIGMDFGLKDPFAAVYVAVDMNNNWYVYDEIYQPDLPIDRIGYALHMKMGDRHFTRIIGDSAGATEIASLRSAALGDNRVWVTPAVKGKDSLRAGIRLVKTHLYVREETGKPKLFITSNCTNLIRELQSYKYMRNPFGEVSEIPEDRNNHLLDALRYLFLDQKHIRSRKERKTERVYDPDTGRLLS